MQNCDLLIVVGSHLCIPVTGTVFKSFAREAKIVMVDIDEEELNDRTVPVHIPVCADAGDFLRTVLARGPFRPAGSAKWRELCGVYHRKYNAPPTAAP